MLAELLKDLTPQLDEFNWYFPVKENLELDITVYHENPDCCMERGNVTSLPDILVKISEHVCGEEVSGWKHMRKERRP